MSDSWTFLAGRSEVVSSYWRPCRTIYLAIGYRLFGSQSALGWHLCSLALHLGALATAQAVLRYLGASSPLTGAILLLFAVHPTRVESITFISAFQDPLAAILLLGSLALVLGSPPNSPWIPRIRVSAAVALYALALLSKEVAITFPAVVFVVLLTRDRWNGTPQSRVSIAKAVAGAAPFLLTTAAYLAARKAVLGVFFSRGATAPFSVTPLTLPRQFTFYLAESLFPFSVGPVHPIRTVQPGNVGFLDFWLPLVLSAAALAALFLAARRFRLRLVGLALFLFLLAPSLPASNLPVDRVVQDRYLYLPMLGLLSVLVPALSGGLSRLPRVGPRNAAWAVLALAIAASLPLGLETARYAYAWRSDASLWEWGVRTDPGSPIALGQHAIWLYKAGRTAEARSFADRAVRAGPGLHDAVLTRARIGEADRRLADAERDYRQALKLSPDRPGSWTDLALFYQRNGRPDEAVRLLRAGRDRLPFARAALTDALAEALHQLGRTEEALLELEAVRPRGRNEIHSAASAVLYHIGLMNLELGRNGEAQTAFADFLDASARGDDPENQRRRGQAKQILSRLAHPSGTRERPSTPPSYSPN